MGSHGIKDQVAIVGMGCTPFGEHWDKGADDLLIDAAERGVRRRPASTRTTSTPTGSAPRCRACAGMTLARPLQLEDKPVTRVENYLRHRLARRCATPPTRWRSGAYDVAMAIGVEKVKDSGYQGLVGAAKPPTDGTEPHAHRGGDVRDVRARPTARSTASTTTQMREVLARISWKNHYNGARNPRAQFRKEVTDRDDLQRRRSWPARCGVFDCSGVADGAAAAIVVPGRGRAQVHRQAALHEGAVVRRRQRVGQRRPRLRLHVRSPRSTRPRPTPTRRPASPTRAREIAMAEVHDCFTPAELLIMEDLGFAERGTAWKEVLAGTFDLDGELPGQPRRRPQELRPPGRARRACA